RVDGDRALGDRVVPIALRDRRDGGQLGTGPPSAEEDSRESPDRIARQRRSPFARRKPAERNGNAGSPPTSAAVAMITVSPYIAVVANHVQPTRRCQRAAAPRNSA